MIRAAAAALFAITIAACAPATTTPQPLGPPVPSGATVIPGGPMEPLPKPTALKVPTSHQEAHDTLLAYLQKTVDALPPGTSLDSSRYGNGDGANYCDDNPTSNDSPMDIGFSFDMKLPPGAGFNAIIARTGDIWKQWGWQVIERDGFPKPNRFGYTPDGYTLQIEARPDPKYPPSIAVTSPCFPGNLRNRAIHWPPVIEQHP